MAMRTGIVLLYLLYSWMPNPALARDECDNEQHIQAEFGNGAAWSLCWNSRTRENLVLSHVRYQPPGQVFLSVFNSLSLSQLHVSYDDDDITYNDVTQFGLGAHHVGTLTKNDCPDGELIDVNGSPGLCTRISEKDEAYQTAQGSRQAQALSLFSVSHVGSYAYLITWTFYSDGSVQPSIGAAGALQRSSDHTHSPHGRELEGSPEKSWLSHTHNYYWRMDFDLGDNNLDDRFSEIDLVPDALGRRSRVTRTFSNEAARLIEPDYMRSWMISSGNEPITTAPGYSIEPLHYGHKLVRAETEPFTEYDMFVTRQADCERFVSENEKYFPECGSDILEFVNNEPIHNEDIVVWHRISFHHVPRNEDRFNMHSHWDGFVMRARNLNQSTPGHDGAQGDYLLANSANNSTEIRLLEDLGEPTPESSATTGRAGLSAMPLSLLLLILVARARGLIKTVNRCWA